MNIISDKDLAVFLKESPLYSKTKFFEGQPKDFEFNLLDFFEEKAFKFYCPTESDFHTFKVKKTHALTYSSDYILCEKALEFYKDDSDKINYSFHLRGECQSCNYTMDFLINIFSEQTFKKGELVLPTTYLKKIGQYPPFERMPEKEVFDYLTEEDKENYKRALSNLAVSYGIGAFAYFRRIIENEIKRIVKDISLLEFDGVDKIRKAWTEYETNHQMSNLIDNIYDYLPKSLKDIGDNPIKLLHQQLSGGIHEYSEGDCLEKAKKIDTLLRYIIKKVNSEKYELIAVRNAMKGLREQM